MAKSRRSTGLVVIVLLLAAAAVGWYFFGRSADVKPVYTTVTVDRGSLAQVVTATGSLQPVTSVEIGSQVSGLITDVLVDYNAPVKAGQLIAKIDSSTYEQRLRQAEADLASSKASHTLTRLNTERTRVLRTQNLVSAQELDQAEAQLSQADAALLTREAAVENAKVDLSRCSIFSPIDGIVIDRQTDVGKTVAASFNAPTLFIIANDLTQMQIHASISEADIGTVALEQPVNFTVDAFPNRQFRGRVIQIRNSPKTESNVVTYQTIIEVRNDDQKLKPGMTANVSIVIAERPNALRLPNGGLRARIPDQLLPAAKPNATPGTPAPAGAAPVTATREQVMAMLAEVGFTPGSGPPSPEVRAKLAELAKSRGLTLPEFGRGRGAAPAEQPTITTRTVYKLGGTTAQPLPEPVTVKLGITDGTHTEIIEGLAEGDVLISSVFLPGATTSTPASSPFGGPRRF